MTTTSRDPLMCRGCGHTGAMKLKENDQPFSSLWEVYSLEGFDGGSLTITSFKQMPSDILAALHPRCPVCGSTDITDKPS